MHGGQHLNFAALQQEFATERELCWHLCMTLGLAKQHGRLAKALAETGIDEKQQPLEYRAQAQVFCPLKHTHLPSASLLGLICFDHPILFTLMVWWLLQAMLAAGQAARASLCLKVLLDGSLDQQKPDILVLLFLVKSGFSTGTVASLQGALGHARSA